MWSTIPVSGGLGHQNVEGAGTHAFHQASLIVQHLIKGVDTLRPTSEGLKNPPEGVVPQNVAGRPESGGSSLPLFFSYGLAACLSVPLRSSRLPLTSKWSARGSALRLSVLLNPWPTSPIVQVPLHAV